MKIKYYSGRKFRPEIQGLRAIAVIAVLLFHIWPNAIPGGYVGVDVFFVISGYLITKLLVSHQIGKGRIQLLNFYVRRIRRLLPAAALVLVSIVGATFLLAPVSLWGEFANHVVASTLYVENWYLGHLSIDYLGAENTPSPTQHYWSLSIEEQFYFIWPLLIMLAGSLAVKFQKSSRKVLFGVLLFIFAGSLFSSIYVTFENQTQGYFATYTRTWELALGGLLAIAGLRLSPVWRLVAGFTGFAMVIVSCLALTEESVFPGYIALLPTIGASLLIVSEESDQLFSVYTLLKTRLAQYLGDISYSLYLWHWPVITYFKLATGRNVDLFSGIGLIAVSLILAHITKIYVEDRYRPGLSTERRSLRRGTVWLTTVLMLLPLASAATLWTFSMKGTSSHQTAAKQSDLGHYPGAEAFFSNAKVPPNVTTRPELAQVKRDLPRSYRGDRCHLGIQPSTPKACIYGDPASKRVAFIVGDSHAANWIPALDEYAKSNKLRLLAYTKSACPVLDRPLRVQGKNYVQCSEWARQVIQIINTEKPEILFIGQSANARLFDAGESENKVQDMKTVLERTWAPILTQDIRVIAFADTPRFSTGLSDCFGLKEKCNVPINTVLQPDPLFVWSHSEPRLRLLNFNAGICPDGLCRPVVGNVLVWRDKHHLTATFSRSLAPEIERRLGALED